MRTPQPSPLPPLRFERIALEKVWGGRGLERAPGIALPAGRPIGETWELSDHGEHRSVVAGGPLAGTRLADLLESDGERLLGRSRRSRDGAFPLLVKFLDACEALSVQVHPHPEAAARREGACAKTECWYVLAARPGAVVYLGPRRDVEPSEFARRARGPEVLSLLEVHPVEAGSFVHVPAGTVHAVGMGVTLVEVQQTSDTTYRIWDWGRTGRELHVDAALDAIRFGVVPPRPSRPVARRAGGAWRAELVDCAEFAVERVEPAPSDASDTGGAARILVALAGRGVLSCAAGAADLAPGDVWLLPASTGAYRVEGEGLSVLEVRTKG